MGRSPFPAPGLLALVLALALLPLTALGAQAPSRSPAPLRLEGELRVPTPGGGTQDETLALRILPEGYGLVDLAGRSILGFPVLPLSWNGQLLAFSMGEGAGRVDFSGRTVEGGRVEGKVSQGQVEGSFVLAPAVDRGEGGAETGIEVPGGVIRGSLLLPEGKGPWPLLILVSGAGSADRNGNNYQVPGRNDSLLALARALAADGVASFRYDKRGTGESLALAPDESVLRFDDYLDDLRRLVALFSRDGRFGLLSVAGTGEGALVAAAALRDDPKARVALLCAGAKSALDSFREAIEAAPAELKEEGRAILASVLSGKPWPEPSTYFADFFRPSFQAYLGSWLHLELKTLLPAFRGELLLVQGDRDMQVELADFLGLAVLRPTSPALVAAGMNHVLKEVPPEVDLNLASFSDPSYPVSGELVEALSAFARGGTPPPGIARADGGRLPGGGGAPEPAPGPVLP